MVPGSINMEIQRIVSHLSKIKLDQFQIKQILNMVEKYIETNEPAATPVIEYCLKCAKKHPKMIKAGQIKNGKQMYRCTNCNKRFVADTGQSINFLFTSRPFKVGNRS